MKVQEVNYTPKEIKIIKDTEDEVILKYASTSFFMIWFTTILTVIFVFHLWSVEGYFFSDDKEAVPNEIIILLLCFYLVFLLSIYRCFNRWTKVIVNKEYLIVKNKKYHLNDCRIRGDDTKNPQLVILDYGRELIRLPTTRGQVHDTVLYIQKVIKRFDQVPTIESGSTATDGRTIKF